MRTGRSTPWIAVAGAAAMVAAFSAGCHSKGADAPSWLRSTPPSCSMALSGQVGWVLENREFQVALSKVPLADQTLDLFLKKAKIHPAGEPGRITIYLFDLPKSATPNEEMAQDFLLQFDGFKDPQALQLALVESFPPEGSLMLGKKDCPLYVMMDINKVKVRALVDPQQRILIGDLRALARRASQGDLTQKPDALSAGEWIDAKAPIAGYVNPEVLLSGLGSKVPAEYAHEIPKGLQSLVWSVTPAKDLKDPKAPHRLELAVGGTPEGINQASHWLQRLVAAAGQIGAQQPLTPVLVQEKNRVGIRLSASNEQLNAILQRFGQPWVSTAPGKKPPRT